MGRHNHKLYCLIKEVAIIESGKLLLLLVSTILLVLLDMIRKKIN